MSPVRILSLISICFVRLVAARAEVQSDDLPYILHGKYFDFCYQRESWDAAGFARFADGFVELVNRDFLELPFAYPIKVLVLTDRARFKQYLSTRFRVIDPPNWGMYFSDPGLFVTFEDSGIGTFAHEIMHPLVGRNIPDCPVWATEAIPAFFEKFFGYWDRDRIVAQWGYQNPWRVEALGARMATLELSRILSDPRPVTEYANSERRLLSMFLWEHGKFRLFLKLVKDQKCLGYRSYFEAALGKPLEEIEPIWKKYLANITANRTAIRRIPASAVFPDRASYETTILALHLWRQEPVEDDLEVNMPTPRASNSSIP